MDHEPDAYEAAPNEDRIDGDVGGPGDPWGQERVDHEDRHVVLADGVRAEVGDEVFNYYDMRKGTIKSFDTLSGRDLWFDLDNGDYVDGSRCCSIETAVKKGWLK
jgi:hypothetical protein